jgi:hypothetical protein
MLIVPASKVSVPFAGAIASWVNVPDNTLEPETK